MTEILLKGRKNLTHPSIHYLIKMWMNAKLTCVHKRVLTQKGVTNADVFLASDCETTEHLVKVCYETGNRPDKTVIKVIWMLYIAISLTEFIWTNFIVKQYQHLHTSEVVFCTYLKLVRRQQAMTNLEYFYARIMFLFSPECYPTRWGNNCEHICQCGVGAIKCDRIRGCLCQPGWAGQTCDDDINECDHGNACGDVNAMCSNGLGGYDCSCRVGFAFSEDGFCEGKSLIIWAIQLYENGKYDKLTDV